VSVRLAELAIVIDMTELEMVTFDTHRAYEPACARAATAIRDGSVEQSHMRNEDTPRNLTRGCDGMLEQGAAPLVRIAHYGDGSGAIERKTSQRRDTGRCGGQEAIGQIPAPDRSWSRFRSVPMTPMFGQAIQIGADGHVHPGVGAARHELRACGDRVIPSDFNLGAVSSTTPVRAAKARGDDETSRQRSNAMDQRVAMVRGRGIELKEMLPRDVDADHQERDESQSTAKRCSAKRRDLPRASRCDRLSGQTRAALGLGRRRRSGQASRS
jgi:hypothetical protein